MEEKNNKISKKDLAKKGKGFLKEFKEFAVKGNVLDMAVGVIIGGAFGKIVTSLVNDIIMPVISLLIGKVNFENLKFTKQLGEMGVLEIPYGSFIQNLVNFVIIAFSIFLIVKGLNSLNKKEEEVKEEPKKSNEEVLLTEIRDLLKDKN